MSRVKGERSSILVPGPGTLASALLVAASLPPWDVPGLVFVALVPWLADLRRARGRVGAAVQGFWLAFAAGGLSAPWLVVGLREFLQVPWWLAGLGLVVFAALAAWPHWVLFALLSRWALRGEGGRLDGRPVVAVVGALSLSLAWMGLEALTPRPLAAGLGYALHDATHLRQAADLGGVAWLGALVALVNLGVWHGFEAWRDARRGPAPGTRVPVASWLPLALGLGLVGVVWLYGEARLHDLAVEEPQRTLRVAIVQGSIPNRVRLAWAGGDDRAAEKQLSAYALPTEELIARETRPDWVVWPEASFPGAFGHALTRAERGRANKFDRQVLRLGRPIAFGAYDLTAARDTGNEGGEDGERDREDGVGEEDEGAGGRGGDERRVRNGLFLVNPDYARPGSLGFVQRYHKHRLLPFAETVPFARSQWVRRWLPTVGFFAPGPGASVLRLAPPAGPAVRVTPIICSESLDAGYVAEGARQGGQLLLNVGSDGWFGELGEPYFHLAIARMRSVETRLPQVRAANSGISALLLPDGRIAARTQLGSREVLDVEVPVPAAREGGRSAFVRGGSSSPVFGGVLGLAGCAILGAVVRRQPPGRTEGH